MREYPTLSVDTIGDVNRRPVQPIAELSEVEILLRTSHMPPGRVAQAPLFRAGGATGLPALKTKLLGFRRANSEEQTHGQHGAQPTPML